MIHYHGSKFRLAPWIIDHFPDHKGYVEPYGGSAGVLIRKPRSYHEVYNDLNGDLVNLFEVLRDTEKAKKLRKALKLTPYSRKEYEKSYEPAEDPVERARRMVFSHYACFGGGGRGVERTGFRAKWSYQHKTMAQSWPDMPEHLNRITKRLQGVVIESREALDLISQQDESDTLFYVDPPYPPDSHRDNSHSYSFEMSDDDHRDLADCLHALEGRVVLSGYACDLYNELFDDWKRFDRQNNTQGDKNATESLWLNPAAQANQPQTSLFEGDSS